MRQEDWIVNETRRLDCNEKHIEVPLSYIRSQQKSLNHSVSANHKMFMLDIEYQAVLRQFNKTRFLGLGSLLRKKVHSKKMHDS